MSQKKQDEILAENGHAEIDENHAALSIKPP